MENFIWFVELFYQIYYVDDQVQIRLHLTAIVTENAFRR